MGAVAKLSTEMTLSTADLIRKHALSLFAQRGFAAVSMREIADAVGIRVGGLYNHFPTKQDILRDLMFSHLEDLLAQWHDADPGGADPVVRFIAFVRFHVHFHFVRPEAVFIAYMELRALEPENFAKIRVLRHQYEQIVRTILQAGTPEHFSIDDIPVVTRALIAMLTGVTTWYRPGGALSIAEIENIYVGLALRSVGLKPENYDYKQ